MRRIVLKDLPAVETVDASGLKQILGGSFSFGMPSQPQPFLTFRFTSSLISSPNFNPPSELVPAVALPDLDAGGNARRV
jgi:hypothetical protein